MSDGERLTGMELHKRRMMMWAWENKMLEEHGWFMRAVYLDDGVHMNHVTHGLDRIRGHLNFQITLPIPQESAYGIINEAVAAVKNGFHFESDKIYYNILQDMPVLMKEYMENDRRVLRIILPDPEGLLPCDTGCDPKYMIQLDVLE